MSTIVYLLNGIDGNSLTQGVFSNNKMLKFGIGGKYLGEFPLSYSYSRLREIDFVSIINVKNQMEVAYVIDKEFKKYPIYTDVYEIINWLNKQPSLVFSAQLIPKSFKAFLAPASERSTPRDFASDLI